MSEYIVTIDFGSSKIAGMVAQKDKNGLLKILAIESEVSDGVKRGFIYNHSEAATVMSRLVRKLENRAKIKIGKIYVGLGGHTLRSIINSVPKAFDSETEITEDIIKSLAQANDSVMIDNASVYEIIEQEFVLDGDKRANPLECLCSHVEGKYLMVVGKVDMDKQLCACLERTPFKLADMFTAPVVTSDSLISPREKELGCVVIDFGAETTTVVIYGDNYMRHIAVIPFGGKTVSQDIKDLQVVFTDAEKLKKGFGCALVDLEKEVKTITIPSSLHNEGNHKVNTRSLAMVIQARLDEILEMVCMQIVKSGYGNQLRAGVIITGGASQQKGLSELIELKTGLKVRKASFEHLLSDVEDVEQLTPAYSLLIGLANFGTEDCQVVEVTNDISPVPPPKKPRKTKGKGFRFKEIIERTLFNDNNEFDTQEKI
jgi:cell division protein FtsA